MNTDKIFSPKVRIKNGKLLRKVDDISLIERLLHIFSDRGYLSKNAIDTKIYSREENLVEHPILRCIIHSGEYTESMAYDVNKLSRKMALNMVEEKIYAYDLLPHNFTFYNGDWLLFDFDSFVSNPKSAITDIRGFYKIVFSNYEILRLIDREKLGQYYLTRYKIEYLIKIIPFYRWLLLFVRLQISILLHFLGLHKLNYLYLNHLFNSYSKNHIKNYFEYKKDNRHDLLTEILKENSITSAFCIGENAAQWALSNEFAQNNIFKVVYIDDYKKCDEYYNFVVQQGFKNVIPAVLYPLVDDENIPDELNYRALYDSYAKERFYSDCVILLDSIKIKENLFKELTDFTSNMLILLEENCTTEEVQKLRDLYENVEILARFIVATGRKKPTRTVSNKAYIDSNRGPFAKIHSEAVKKLVNK